MNPMETDGTSFTDSGLSPNTTYKYYVIAANPYGSCSSIPYSINSMPTATTFP
ncbi:MAG: fibronectin type III domain-containing protein [Bacteroidetes bacterium]|nr:fibronectin type III domain-containing protein [Bacteroidota bacterium]